jgi:hypothetical protein
VTATLVVSGAVSRAADAGPPDRAVCVSAYERAQVSMRRGSLQAAREQLGVCLDEACARVLRADCARWLDEVEARLPAVLLACEGPDGRPRNDARVLVDGTMFAERIDGKALEIDPGEHTFRFVLPGEAPLEQRFVVVEGDKLQRVLGRFPQPERVGLARPVPWPTYVLGAAGVAAAGGFVAAGVAGLSGKDDLELCKPDCPGDQVSAVRTKFIVADVLLAVSLLSFAAATYFYLTRGPSTPTASTPRGGTATRWVLEGGRITF